MHVHTMYRDPTIVRCRSFMADAFSPSGWICVARSEHQIVHPVVQNGLLALGLVQCVQQGEHLIVFLSKHAHRFAVRV
jgi:hypothetical protein